MKDYITKAVTFDGKIRAYSAVTTEVVKKAFEIHDTYPVVTAALGRALTGASLMGTMLKGENDKLTLQIRGDGPIGGLVVTSDNKGNVKGYVNNPYVNVEPRDDGKLNVGKAVGKNGYLNVVRDMGLKEPYASQVDLVSGEIAEDLTVYFAKSEQVPTVVALGVLLDKEKIVKAAGGYIIQLMPQADESVIDNIEKILPTLPSVTQMISDGLNDQDILANVLNGYAIKFLDRIEPAYYCDCSKEKVEKALISIGKEELNKLIKEDKKAELNCHFCNKKYVFKLYDLKELLKQAK